MMVVTNKNKNSKLQQHVHQVEFYAVPPRNPLPGSLPPSVIPVIILSYVAKGLLQSLVNLMMLQ